MNRDDLLALKPGDTIIGFAGDWSDEWPVLAVGAVTTTRSGKVRRVVTCRHGQSRTATLQGGIVEDDDEQRAFVR